MTFYVWKCCEVNASRKSFPFHEIIWFEFNIHPVCWNWYNFLNPVAGVWTFIWTCQVCHQYLISFRINLLNCYVIIIIVRVKLIKMKGLKNCTSKPDKLHLGIYNHLSHWKLNAVDYHSELSNVYFYISLKITSLFTALCLWGMQINNTCFFLGNCYCNILCRYYRFFSLWAS